LIFMNGRLLLAARVTLTLVVLTGLAFDAYVHFDLAAGYDGVRSDTVSQGDLFRVEGTLAIVAAIALVLLPRLWTALLAFVIAGGGVGAVLLYRYVDVGAIGPVPDMYEPLWYAEKTQSAWVEGIAALAALALAAVLFAARHDGRTPSRLRLHRASTARV
jgi:hypothetical protein